jgi:hypothetical protein
MVCNTAVIPIIPSAILGFLVIYTPSGMEIITAKNRAIKDS